MEAFSRQTPRFVPTDLEAGDADGVVGGEFFDGSVAVEAAEAEVGLAAEGDVCLVLERPKTWLLANWRAWASLSAAQDGDHEAED